ncbi:hypothetical protein Tco_0905723 [Tanacetum coccineum]
MLAESSPPLSDVDKEDIDLDEWNIKQCKRKICDGHAAVRVLSSSGVAPYNDVTLEDLKTKHPFKPPPSLPHISIDHHHLVASPAVVLDRSKSFPRGTSCGWDGLRAQHLMDYLSRAAVAISDELVSSITQVVNLFFDGKCPNRLGEYIASAPLTPLVKLGDGIRPIAVGTVWRRLVSKLRQTFDVALIYLLYSDIVTASVTGLGDWQWRLYHLTLSYGGLVFYLPVDDFLNLCLSYFSISLLAYRLSFFGIHDSVLLLPSHFDYALVRSPHFLYLLDRWPCGLLKGRIIPLTGLGRSLFSGLGQTMNADMLLYSWDEGLDVCVDLTGSSPLTQTGMVDFIPCHRQIDVATAQTAVALLNRTESSPCIIHWGTSLSVQIFNRISFAIAKGKFIELCGCVRWKPSRDNNSSTRDTKGFKGLLHALNATMVEEVKYGEFGRPAPFNESNGAKFRVDPPGYYTRTDNRPPYREKRPSLEELMNKH